MKDTINIQTQLKNTRIAYQEALQIGNFKSSFLGKIAHEIRSPLSSIIGLQQLIINDLCDNVEEEKEFIQEAHQYAKKLMSMIDQLIELSKLEAGKIDVQAEKFNLSELLEDIYNLMYLEGANKSIKMSFQTQAPNLIVKTDKTRLMNILFYLLEIIIDVSDRGTINLNLTQDISNQKCFITITFPCNNFTLIQPEETDLSTASLEELKRLHGMPEFSNQMKMMLSEALLNMIQGNLILDESSDEETPSALMSLQLALPFEIV